MSLWTEITHAYNELTEVHYLSIPTWLALGAVLQLLALACLPGRLSGLPPIMYLIYCLAKAVAGSRHIFTGTFDSVKRGRWTAELPKSEEHDESDGLVMFVLGARINHPLGPLFAGSEDVGRAFEAMWDEAETNRDKWGYLGHTGTLQDNSDSEGTTLAWLSYWKHLEGLQAFAAGPVHQIGQVDYNKKKWPYMGIMHETFHAPRGKWETIYDNMTPWGFGKVTERMQTLIPKSSSTAHSTLAHRMRRNAVNASRNTQG